MGQRGSETVVALEALRSATEHLIGEPQGRFSYALEALERRSPGHRRAGGRAMRIRGARHAFDYAERDQFGRRSGFQGMEFKLGDMAARLRGGAGDAGAGGDVHTRPETPAAGGSPRRRSSWRARRRCGSARQAVQVFGGYGYSSRVPGGAVVPRLRRSRRFTRAQARSTAWIMRGTAIQRKGTEPCDSAGLDRSTEARSRRPVWTSLELFDLFAEHGPRAGRVQLTSPPAATTEHRGHPRHDARAGPGGTRCWTYASRRRRSHDVLRLSRGMTYKAAVAGLNLGGGKAVIIGDNKTDTRDAHAGARPRRSKARGPYITAEDVGTSVADMDYVHMETEYVVGIHGTFGRSIARHGVRRLPGDEGVRPEEVRRRRPGQEDDRDPGRGPRRLLPLARNLAEEGAKLFVTGHRRGNRVERAAEELGRRGRRPGRDLRRGSGHLRSMCARRRYQQTDDPPASRAISSPALRTTSWRPKRTTTAFASAASSTRRTTSSMPAA